MGTVQDVFCDTGKRKPMRSKSSPAELSTTCTGREDRSYYAALIWQVTTYFDQWLDRQFVPVMWETRTVAQNHQRLIVGKGTGTCGTTHNYIFHCKWCINCLNIVLLFSNICKWPSQSLSSASVTFQYTTSNVTQVAFCKDSFTSF